MTEKFLETLSPVHPMVFRKISTAGVSETIKKEEALVNKEANIYFLWGVNTSAVSMTDHDIDVINYIRLDIDIKKWVMECMWAIADRDDILWFIDEIKDLLEENKFLKDWSYIIYSWWGCHIYYSNIKWVKISTTITPKVWQLAMKRIYTLYNETINEEYLNADMAVCNTARIMRLPWSVNQKNWIECEIIYARPEIQSPLLGHVKSLWLDSLEKNKRLSDERAKEIEEMRADLIANWWWDTDLQYQIINKFPAYIVAEILLPEFKFDWKKNFKDQGKLKWYYYTADVNAICNWWSAEFAWWTTESNWNNFSLVSKQLWLSHHETFKWFEEKFWI